MTGDYTFLVAVFAGLVSFLSPCVLPLVPAYLGQLTAVAVAAGPDGTATASRWTALRHAVAYVAGFGTVFTLLGITAAFAGGALADYIPTLRIVGGAILVVMGLSLAGLLPIPFLERTWRPLDAGASASVATMTGGMSLAPAEAGVGGRVGSRLVGGKAGLGTSFALGSIFAIGWTPCIGVILGGILTMAAVADTKLQGALLLVGYTLGLGIPFLVIAVFYDRAPALMRPLVRHGRTVSLIGGLLVAAIGLAMIFDLLVLLPRYFNFAGVSSMTPELVPPPRKGLIGPFTGRQLLGIVVVIVLVAIGLTLATRPIAAGPANATPIPVSTPFLVGPATEGLQPGQQAPELLVKAPDGSSVPLTDLDGKPVQLADLRGKLVWLNFWATWCPPCQSETPVLRDMDEAYGDKGLAIVGIAVQETTPADVQAYADRYELGYDIAFDASADIFDLYKVYALPTQFFIDPSGKVLEVVNGPMTDESAKARIEAWLPKSALRVGD